MREPTPAAAGPVSDRQLSVAPRPRRVLVQVNSLALGGTQINAVDTAWALREHGFESTLVGPRDTLPTGDSLFDVAADRNVPLAIIDRPTTTRGGAHDLARLAAAAGADLVHVYGASTFRAAYWGPCRLGRRPLVMTVYEMAVPPTTYRAPHLIVGTGYLVDDLQGRRGQVALVSPPVDLDRDAPGSADAQGFVASLGAGDGLRVVVVSRLDDLMKATGIEHAMQAIAQIPSQTLTLVVVGTGPAEARLRDLAEQINSRMGRRAVVMTGAMADPRAAYDCADVVIGMGGSAARGLAFGKPLVVAGEFGYFRAFGPDSAAALYRNSFWSDESSRDPVGELRRELEPLLRDGATRRRLGAFGRTFAEQNFGLGPMAARVAATYRDALTTYGAGDWLSDLDLEIRQVASGGPPPPVPDTDAEREGRGTSVLNRPLLWLQRHGPRPPAWVRRPLRVVLAASSAAEAAPADWSVPLVPARTRGPLVVPDESVVAPPAGASGPAVGRALDRGRVLLATGALDTGGQDEVVTFLALRLREKGFRTAVLHTPDAPTTSRGRLARLLHDEDVEVVVAARPAATDFVASWAPDVISAHGTPPWLLSTATASRVPYVETLHGVHTIMDIDWQAEQTRSRDVTRFVAVSELVRQQYLAGNPTFPGDRIVTVPNGVDDRRRATVSRAEARRALGLTDEFVFVSLARYSLQKNSAALVREFHGVAERHPEAHLVLSGRVQEPMYYAQVAAATKAGPHADRIHLRRHIPSPSWLLEAADGFVLNSFFEGWALASMEAMCAGVPVVMSEVGGAREQLGQQGQRGVMVQNPLGDPLISRWAAMRDVAFRRQHNGEELVDAMCTIVREREQWAARREALRVESSRLFDLDDCLEGHAAVLSAAVHGVAH